MSRNTLPKWSLESLGMGSGVDLQYAKIGIPGFISVRMRSKTFFSNYSQVKKKRKEKCLKHDHLNLIAHHIAQISYGLDKLKKALMV